MSAVEECVSECADACACTDSDRAAAFAGRCGPQVYGGPCWLMPGHQGPHHCYREDVEAVAAKAAHFAMWQFFLRLPGPSPLSDAVQIEAMRLRAVADELRASR